MSKLKIIEATYYAPSNIDGGFNVTKDLIQMLDTDNGCLFYDGSYNDIFSDPAKRVKKRLKIILEYNGEKRTHVYKEDENIKLPDDLNLEKYNNEIKEKADKRDKKSEIKSFLDVLNLKPNFYGIGFDVKKLFSLLKKRKFKIFASLGLIIIITGSSHWWYSPTEKFIKDIKAHYFTDYGDLSRTLNKSVFAITEELKKIPSDKEKEKYIENYSYLRTNREYGYIDSISTSSESELLVKIESGRGSIICIFNKKWKKKLLILSENKINSESETYFYGVIEEYDSEKKLISLFNCNLLQ